MPGYANPQALNRYSYVLNNPLRYTDPSGHRATECDLTEGCGSVSQAQKDKDAQTLARLKSKGNDRKCAEGNKAHCSGNPAEIIAFTGTMLIGGAALETFILGGGVATAVDATIWKTAEVCSGISLCWVGIGAAGASSNTSGLPRPVYDQASDQHVFPRHVDLGQFLNRSKFISGEGGQAFADEVFNIATKVENQSDGFVRVYADLGRTVGTQGETWGRIVMDSVTGWVKTQFPQFPPGP